MSTQSRQDREVPTWDNDPETFNDFEDRVWWYERSLKPSEKKQAVPRIVRTLTGTPWLTIQDLSKKDLARLCDSGTQALLEFLRQTLVEDGVPEVGRRFGEYLGCFRRKNQQGMRTYVQNHRHLQNQVEQAIKKAEKRGPQTIDYRGKLKEINPNPEQEVAESEGNGMEEMLDEAFGTPERENAGTTAEETPAEEDSTWNSWWWAWSWGGYNRGTWDTSSQRSHAYGRTEPNPAETEFVPTKIVPLKQRAWEAIQEFSKLSKQNAETSEHLEALVSLLEKHRE